MQVAPRTLRDVPVSWGVKSPAELGPMLDLVEGAWGAGRPFRFVTDLAAVTNVLLPREANLMHGFFTSSAAVVGGPIALADGSLAPRSIVLGTGATSIGTPATIPVLPGSKATGSANVQGSGTIRLTTYRADRSPIGTVAASITASEPMGRESATWTVAADAHWVTLGFSGFTRVSRPALSFTDEPMGWSPGEGIVGALVGIDRSVLLAAPQSGRQLLTGSATIVELGSR